MNYNNFRVLFIILAALTVFVSPVSADITGVTATVTPATASAFKTSTLDCGFTVAGNLSIYRVNVTWLKNSAAHTADNQNGIVATNNTLTHTDATGDIESADLAKGDSWQCRATAYNTEGDTMTVTSAASVIQNSAPVITSNADTTAQTGVAYTYTVVASDPDGDSLTYSLDTYPTNMSISTAGVITWTPSETQRGSFTVVARVTDSSGASVTQSYTLVVSNIKLAIYKLSVKCSPESCDDNLDVDGGAIDSVIPGSKIKLSVRVENLWDSSVDRHEIKKIEAVGILDEMGDEDEQEESVDLDNIDPGDRSNTGTLEFVVPEAVDEDTYNLELTVTGEDQDGTDYEISFDIDVNVEKQNHLLWIKKAVVQQSTISCSRNIVISTNVKNIGANDEDGMELTLINSALGISKSDFFDLDSGDYDDSDTERLKDYSFKIADSVAPGTYDIEVKAYYENANKYESATIPLIVQKCSTDGSTGTTGSTGTSGSTGTTTTPPKQEPENVQVVTNPSTTQIKVPVTAKPVSTGGAASSEAFIDSDTFLILLIGAIVVLLIVCAVMIFALARK
jgi:hypothetical protein